MGTYDKEVLALDVQSGKIKWRQEVFGEIEASVLISSNGILYVGTVSGTFYVMREDDGLILDSLDFREIVLSNDGDPSPLHVPSGISSSALLSSNNRIYLTLTDGRLIAFQDAAQLKTSLCTIVRCARPMLSMDPQHTGQSPYQVRSAS